MSQLTCSLCDIKVDELQWKEHLISTNDLQLCKEYKCETAIRFFELIFSSYHNRKYIYSLKDERTFNFWQQYFATKLPKEKFLILCNDSNKISELEVALTSDLLFFINNCTYDIRESYLDSLDKIIICRICNDEVYKSLLFDHITSKRHREI